MSCEHQHTSGFMQVLGDPPLTNQYWPYPSGGCPYCNPLRCPTCGRPYLGGPVWNSCEINEYGGPVGGDPGATDASSTPTD
jgi:hypothetical protein